MSTNTDGLEMKLHLRRSEGTTVRINIVALMDPS